MHYHRRPVETLVTGATGFAGRQLVAALRAEGHAVRALAREGSRPEARARLERLGATIVTGDVRDEATIEAAARGAEVVFHCARIEDPRAPRAELEAVNLVGVENTLAACHKARARRVVFLSTADVTQGAEARPYVDEDHPQPATFLDARTETRALAEDLVVAASDDALETVTLRPGWLWGADDTCLAPRLVRAARDGSFRWIDGGRSLCATTHARNLAAGMALAATATEAAGGVYYLTDDERVSAREFLTRLAAALGVTLPRASLPYGLAYALAWAGERLGSRPSHTRAEVASLGRSAHFNVQRARKELGYAPVVDVSEGLRGVKAWAARVGLDAVAKGAIEPDAPGE